MRFEDRMKLFCVVLDRLEWIEWNRIGFRKNDGWWKCDYLYFLYKSDNFFINMLIVNFWLFIHLTNCQSI